MLHFHKSFLKDLKKSPKNIQLKVRKAIDVFQEDEFDTSLNNHPLKGSFKGCRSIKVTPDFRIIYRKEQEETIFIALGTHSELYR